MILTWAYHGQQKEKSHYEEHFRHNERATQTLTQTLVSFLFDQGHSTEKTVNWLCALLET